MALTKVVVCRCPFQSTADCDVKLAPVTVSVKVGPPALIFDGEIELILSGDGLIVKSSVFEVPYVGSLAETVALPVVTMSDDGICAVSCVLLTKFVGT